MSGDSTAETDMAAFRASAGNAVASVAVGAANANQDTTEQNVPAGTYTYGAFSKNAGGFGPGDLTDTTIVVS